LNIFHVKLVRRGKRRYGRLDRAIGRLHVVAIAIPIHNVTLCTASHCTVNHPTTPQILITTTKMSDSEDTSAPQPPLDGKTLSTPQTQQPQPSQPYKSWRKKYRKMKHRFDALLHENKRLYRHDHLLSALVIRLREDLE